MVLSSQCERAVNQMHDVMPQSVQNMIDIYGQTRRKTQPTTLTARTSTSFDFSLQSLWILFL